MYRIIENQSGLTLASESGNLARTTEGGIFMTHDRAMAEEALSYLNQSVPPMGKRIGSHTMKSIFGVMA